jgi:hypothetical protein
LDAATPPETPPAAIAQAPAPTPGPPAAAKRLAATEYAPREGRERELCTAAGRTDTLYIAITAKAAVGSIVLHVATKNASDVGVRMLGPGFVGLSWGWLLGGGYLAFPKCHPNFAGEPPPEGGAREIWPVALTLATLSGATAPMLTGVITGPLVSTWTTEERVGRLVVAGVMGFAGALLPYLLPPRTWRAARELERLRVEAGPDGAVLGWHATF